METLKLIFNPTTRTHYVFIFVTGIATSLRVHVLTLRSGWGVMLRRRRGNASLRSAAHHQRCMRLGSCFGFSPDVQVRSLWFRSEPWSRAWMCSLSWAVLSDCLNPVAEWVRENPCLYLWAIQQADMWGSWESFFLFESLWVCEVLLWSAGFFAFFCSAFWVQAEPNPWVPHRSQENTRCSVLSCRETCQDEYLWVRRTTWKQRLFPWLPPCAELPVVPTAHGQSRSQRLLLPAKQK